MKNLRVSLFTSTRSFDPYNINIPKNYQTDSKKCTFNNFYDKISLFFGIFSMKQLNKNI